MKLNVTDMTSEKEGGLGVGGGVEQWVENTNLLKSP